MFKAIYLKNILLNNAMKFQMNKQLPEMKLTLL